MLIQFFFLFGCHSLPLNRDQSVLVDYSTDGGISWTPITELYYNLYRHPTFISLKLPVDARRSGVAIRWWQPDHGQSILGDWLLDSVRINGDQNNPTFLHVNTTDILLDTDNFPTTDNLHLAEFCGSDEDVVVGTTEDEPSTLTTREVKVEERSMLQFEINVGCKVFANLSVAPVELEYSTDHGVTWNDLRPRCKVSDPDCRGAVKMPSVYYGDPSGQWERVVIPLEGMTVTNTTRFRWIQHPTGSLSDSHWGIRYVYIGPACAGFCGGHGRCDYPQCICDEGYAEQDCKTVSNKLNTQMKDTFDVGGVNYAKWSVVQSGGVKDACSTLVEGTALTLDGPGLRQAVTRDLDLRNARFLQYTAMIGGQSIRPGCYLPSSRDHSVILDFSSDGGITWTTLHILDYTKYLTPHMDYLPLPIEARKESTRFRWWQPLPSDPSTEVPLWAIDNVLVGGTEINPSKFVHSFNDSLQQDDSSAYEFSPHGKVEVSVCSKDDAAMSYQEGLGVRTFTTNQLIVQRGYMLQFKYNKNPKSGRWLLIQTLCLPDNQNMDCRPQVHHQPSTYQLSDYPTWTRVTMELPDRVFSGSTRFRWIQSTPDSVSAGWALDDIYVGEKCTELCRGRGDCVDGRCVCDKGYYGPSCQPRRRDLPSRMYESFEGGIFSAHWATVTGGGIGFGCGALLPFAHGKTLYFNDCGTRQAVTAELDLTAAVKIIFVMQIGCRAQTDDCNVKLGNGANYRGVLLQYSIDKGSNWKLLARHDPQDFMIPRRLAYDVPTDAQVTGTQFRWWQPIHDGAGFDQWAIDKIEIISGRPSYKRKGKFSG